MFRRHFRSDWISILQTKRQNPSRPGSSSARSLGLLGDFCGTPGELDVGRAGTECSGSGDLFAPSRFFFFCKITREPSLDLFVMKIKQYSLRNSFYSLSPFDWRNIVPAVRVWPPLSLTHHRSVSRTQRLFGRWCAWDPTSCPTLKPGVIFEVEPSLA